jgi:hypothetical protein
MIRSIRTALADKSTSLRAVFAGTSQTALVVLALRPMMPALTGAPTTMFPWRKSTASAQGNCVEVAILPDRVLVRDSKFKERSDVLDFGMSAWAEFLETVRAGGFDRFER